ncbi:hypothetical protein JOM56_010894 [Amanita muscaria]
MKPVTQPVGQSVSTDGNRTNCYSVHLILFLNEGFDAITTRGGSDLSDSAHVDPGQYWHGERVWKSSFLHEDFDLMTSSTGLTTERSSIHGSPLRSRKNQETSDNKRSPLDRVPQTDTSSNPSGGSFEQASYTSCNYVQHTTKHSRSVETGYGFS